MNTLPTAHCAFVDSYGDTGLDTSKAGATSFFVVAAVLVAAPNLDSVRAAAEMVRRRHFQTGEIKSRNVGDDMDRRIRILRELSALEFRLHVDAVDKREIDKSSGLIYKRPFLKYLHGQLYRKLIRAFPDIRVTADEHGGPEFMRGFQDYIARRHTPELFPRATFGFASSVSEPLIQVADFIAGSVARVIDPDKMAPGADQIMETIGSRVLSIDEWPPQREMYARWAGLGGASQFDSLVERVCLDQALLFMEENRGSRDPLIQLQVATIKYLVFYSRFTNPSSYVPTALIMNVLRAGGESPGNEQYFRSSVIAKLRDAGVIIASAPRGYKLPVQARDLGDFVDHTCGIALPMIARLKRVRDQILRASMGQLDILGESQYEHLRKFCDGGIKGAV